MTIAELSLFLTPVLIQTAIFLIQLKKLRTYSSFFGALGFLLMLVGLICLIALYGDISMERKRLLFKTFRIMLACGSVLWIFSEFLWLKNRVVIINGS